MFLIVGGVLSIVCLLVSISLLKSIPIIIQQWIVSKPLLSFLFNMGVSVIITMFIGAGMIAGASNLLASVIFAAYCDMYHKKKYIPNMIEKKRLQAIEKLNRR